MNEKCTICNGSGKCDACFGTGILRYEDSREIIYDEYTNEPKKCASCSGTGICSRCHGTGNYDKHWYDHESPNSSLNTNQSGSTGLGKRKCDFCEKYKNTLWKCPDCGTVLCNKCTEKKFTASSIVKAPFTIATLGIIKTKKRFCLKCGSKRIKKI